MAPPRAPAPSAVSQFDLFADSEGTARRNALADTVAGADPARARQALADLAALEPGDDLLGPARLLIDWLERGRGGVPAAADSAITPAAALEARRQLQGALASAAQRLLADRAPAWLQARWADLARRVAGFDFDPAFESVHPAALWLEAGDACAAQVAVERIAAWRRIPAPLGWMVQVRLDPGGPAALEAAWPFVAELAWLAPRRLAEIMARVGHPALAAQGRAFTRRFAGFEDDRDWAWFPAWLLVDEPRLASGFDGAEPALPTPPSEAFGVVRALLRLEGQAGREADRLERRRQLKALHPGLFAEYMSRR
jgi:hypothetical protein